MRIFKNLALTLGLLGVFNLSVSAGEIKPGAVSGSINYQGRLERDNAPVTGIVHLTFRIYNAAEGGTLRWPTPACPSSEITATATQGIFSASIAPCWEVFSLAEQLYLEVQVESDVLSPREPLNSVVYAMVAKKLEDGSSISVTTLAASYQVLLATVSGNVGIGSMAAAPDKKLTVNGGIRILSDGYYFPDGTLQNTAGVAGAGNLSNPSDAVVTSDSDNSGGGDIILQIYSAERARVLASNGNLGVGAAAPSERLEVNGNLANTAGTFAIYSRDYLVSRPRDASNAVFRLMPRDDNSAAPSSISALELYTLTDTSTGTPVNYTRGVMIMTANGLEFYQEKGGAGSELPILFKTGGAERMRIVTGGNVSVGGLPNPTDNFQAAGDISANTGVRGARVSIGDYSTWTNLPNEIRSEAGYHLLLQQTNSYNVGIGTDSPKEKLHVRGSVMADYGISAATAAFSDAVTVGANFTANSGQGSVVKLSSTVIYGTLTVYGAVGSDKGWPAYLASTQTFTGQNTFARQVAALSDLTVANRLGVGAAGFSFAPSEYLQVGDGLVANDDAQAYLMSGAGTGNSKIYFYRGPTEAARLETQNGSNLALVAGNTKSLVDSTYYRIYNSVFWVSTGTNNATPAIFVSSWMGNVGVGTAVLDPNWKLTVSGNIRISGPASNGIIFADGTTLTSANLGGISAGAISHNEDAIVQSDADLNGSGSVVLRAGALDGLALNTGGNVGVGTLYPVARLNVRGGDLVLGTPYNPYASDSKEDLILGGNLVVDGSIEQRAASMAIFSGLTVTNNVYLSTVAAARTGIGTDNPQYKLDVVGDVNLSGALMSGGTQRMSATGVLSNTTWNGATITVPYGGTGVTSLTSGGILYGNGTAAIAPTAVLANGQLLIGDGSGAPTLATLTPTANQVNVTNAAGAITLSLPQDINSGASPAFAGLTVGSLTGVIKGATGVLSAMTGTTNQITRWSDADTIGASSILTDDSARFTVSAPADLTGSITTASSGTFRLTGANQYSIETSSGIKVNNGLVATPAFRMTTGANADYVLVSDGSGNAKWSADTAGAATYIQATVASNDYIRVKGGGSSNAGWLEIATGDDGTEPIYVRQYNTVPSIVNEAVLLDGSGNTSFPGTVTAPTFSGNATSVDGFSVNTAYNDFTGSEIPVRHASGYLYSNWFNMVANVETTNPEYLVGEWGGDKFLRYVTPANVTVGNVSGIVAVANGGTGATTLTGVVRGNGTSAFTASAIVDADVPDTITLTDITQITNRAISDTSGTLAVGRGGTGQSTLTSGYVLVGNGTTAVNLVAGLTVAAFQVVGSTISSTCYDLTFTNGVLTGKTTVTCN
ncbi:MAG: hypothetical protein HY796_01350 [Elusimicrobia bacterium]|nr:hypothetical protein [Elusimicrobiota bacterium]